MKWVYGAQIVLSLAVLLVPTVKGLAVSSFEIRDELQRYHDDGERYVLRSTGEAASKVENEYFGDVEAALGVMGELQSSPPLSELRPGDLVLLQYDQGLAPVELIRADGRFVHVLAAGGDFLLYRRDAFESRYSGFVVAAPDRGQQR